MLTHLLIFLAVVIAYNNRVRLLAFLGSEWAQNRIKVVSQAKALLAAGVTDLSKIVKDDALPLLKQTF
jgi:hypothetical protein